MEGMAEDKPSDDLCFLTRRAVMAKRCLPLDLFQVYSSVIAALQLHCAWRSL